MLDANTAALDAYERRMDKRDMDYSVILEQYRLEAEGINKALGIAIDDLSNMMASINIALEEAGFSNDQDDIEKVINDILGEDSDLVYIFEAVEGAK